MNIRKAVITAAGRTQHTLPLQTLVDRDGVQKSALRIILEEALSLRRGRDLPRDLPRDQSAYVSAAGPLSPIFTLWSNPTRSDTAMRSMVRADLSVRNRFCIWSATTLYIGQQSRRCAQQLAEVAAAESCPRFSGATNT